MAFGAKDYGLYTLKSVAIEREFPVLGKFLLQTRQNPFFPNPHPKLTKTSPLERSFFSSHSERRFHFYTLSGTGDIEDIADRTTSKKVVRLGFSPKDLGLQVLLEPVS